MLAWIALAGLAGCAGGGEDGPGTGLGDGGGTPPPQATVNFSVGDLVAELELEAPAQSQFLLRGTFPIPPGMHIPGSGSSPFILRIPGGGVVNTQVEVVSRYASAAEGADVVEVLAKVDRPATTNPGDRLAYNVVWSPNTSGAIQVDSNVQALLATADALVLRATDVFGHRYEADLLNDLINTTSELKTYRDGHIARQVRTYENLTPVTPVAGATGTLPHMMGAHAYITTWREEQFISLDLRLHNGHQGLDPGTDQDDPVGQLYFNELELRVPAGWTVFQAYETPSLGSTYTEGPNRVVPLVDPLTGTKMHMMPIQAQFHRRLVLCRTGAEERAQAVLHEEWLAFCRDGANSNEERLLSWWNPGSGRYWAQNLPLPTLDQLGSKANQRGALEVEFDGLNQVLLNGTTGPFPIVTGNLGWAHPWGLDIGYMHGGDEIVWWDALEALWTASNEGYRTFQISHRMYTERHATALYDTSGEPYKYEDWLVEGPTQTYLPTYIYFIPWLSLADPHGFTTANPFQVNAVTNQSRKPAYESTLLTYKWIDEAHLIRYTRSPKVLAWAGNDALAKDDLRLQAELCRTSYAPYPQTDNGSAIVTGFASDEVNVDAHPGQGVNIDRTEGWGFDTVATYYALADDGWRGRAIPWAKSIVDFLLRGQDTCSGFIMTYPHNDHMGGQYRLVQSISEAMIQNGLWGMRTTMFDSADSVYANRINLLVRRSVQGMNGSKVWDPAGSTFHFYTALGDFDQDQPPFCNFVPSDGHLYSDNWQTWNILLFGYLLTGDQLYLNRAGMMGGSLNPDLLGGDAWSGEIEVRAGMVALLQNM